MLLEAGVDVVEDAVQSGDVIRVLGTERVEHRLLGAGGVQAALDTEAADRLGEAEARVQHADRADDRVGLGEHLVSGERQPIAARRRRRPR